MAERTGIHAVWVALLWMALTIAAEAAVLTFDVQPGVAATEGEVIDGSFRLLTILGAPVFTFVVAVLAYSLLRFRSRGAPEAGQDGPPLTARPVILGAWLAVTSALALYVIFNPGLTALAALRTHHEPDLLVQVEGVRWQWKVSYPRYGVTTTKEMVLPVGRHVRFDVTAVDVVHSFWVPTFRSKIDAVPGRVTTIHATPNRTITSDADFNARLVCAELCGVGHAIMSLPVRVVEPVEFERWIATARAAAGPADSPALALAGGTGSASAAQGQREEHVH